MGTTLKQIQAKGITETGLKWIALVTMVMDHIHYFFGFTGQIPNGSAWWGDWVCRRSCSALWKGLPTPIIGNAILQRFTSFRSSCPLCSFLLMAYGGVSVRPDTGFYPTNEIMTAFVILMVIWQGIDWLTQKKAVSRSCGGTVSVGLAVSGLPC